MKILVAGGYGLIGSAITKHLKQFYDVSVHDPPKMELADITIPYDLMIDCGRYENPRYQVNLWEIVIAAMKKQGHGRIILFSSIYGHKAPDFEIYPGSGVPKTPLEYAMSKAGAEQATRYLAQQFKIDNIQVNCIAPGGVLNGHSQEFQRNYETSGGASMIETRNILPVVDMLLHPDNAVNGQVITVDAGWSL